MKPYKIGYTIRFEKKLTEGSTVFPYEDYLTLSLRIKKYIEVTEQTKKFAKGDILFIDTNNVIKEIFYEIDERLRFNTMLSKKERDEFGSIIYKYNHRETLPEDLSKVKVYDKLSDWDNVWFVYEPDEFDKLQKEFMFCPYEEVKKFLEEVELYGFNINYWDTLTDEYKEFGDRFIEEIESGTIKKRSM